jgi:hypothetical protein
MSRRREGRRLLGLPESLRHDYYEAGKLGIICRKCGIEKPRADEDEQVCPGKRVFGPDELRLQRELSIPNLLLGFGFHRIWSTGDGSIDPAVVEACELGSAAPFARMDAFSVQQQCLQSLEDAKTIFQSVDAATSPKLHCLAAAMFAVKLAGDGLIRDARNQAVLVGLLLLDEAQSTSEMWGYSEGQVQPLADKMLKTAQLAGYYRGGLGSVVSYKH